MHFGAFGRNVGSDLYDVLIRSPRVQTPDEVKRTLGRAPKEIFDIDGIGEIRSENLLWAAGELEAVLGEDIFDRVRVVDFHADNLGGLYRGVMIDIASKHLDDRYKLLSILVHEFAHDYGADGEKGHIAKIEETWTALARKWNSGC